MRSLWGLMVFLLAVLGSVTPAVGQEMRAASPEVALVERPPTVPDDWQVMDTPWLRMYGTDRELLTLRHLGDVGTASVPELAEELGVPVGGTIHVVVAPTRTAFMALQPGGVPEYADGTAWPSLGHIYLQRPGIRSSDRPVEQVLRHEIVHILLGRAFAPATPPAWLQEGTATVLSGEYDGVMSELLVQAVAAGHTPSVSDLSRGFPATQPQASLAYAESADFIVFLRESYGDGVIADLVAAAARGATLREAVLEVTGDPLSDIEPRWQQRFYGGGLAWLAIFSNWEMWWAVGGVAAMFGLVLARRRSMRRLKHLAAEEARLDALLARLWGRDEVS